MTNKFFEQVMANVSNVNNPYEYKYMRDVNATTSENPGSEVLSARISLSIISHHQILGHGHTGDRHWRVRKIKAIAGCILCA